MLKIEPRFSEAIQGASLGNCYIESNFTGKVQTRLRGRMDIVESGIKDKWGLTLAAFESSKTRNAYMLTQTDYRLDLRLLRRGACSIIKTLDKHYDPAVPCGFAEMRFLGNDYVTDFVEGSYGILFHAAGEPHVLDDLDPLNAQKIRRFKEFDGMEVGSVCVVANRIIASELGKPTWHYSTTGGAQTGEGENRAPVFDPVLQSYEAEYSGDAIVHVARFGGIRLAVFGERTLELWDISGNPDDPFTTSYSGQVYKIGCVPGSIAEIGDVVYFCGVDDLSGRNAIYSIGREGLKKLSENPLDAEITEIIKRGSFTPGSGRYGENASSFYLLHLSTFTLAYNISENSFSRFYHLKGASIAVPFCCLLSSGEHIVGSKTTIYRASDGEPEHTGHFTEKMLMLPVFDNGGAGHFRVKKLTIDMQTITTPRTAPPENNCIIIDYSPDGADTFIGRRAISIPQAGNRKAYPLRLWGMGRCNNLKLRLYTATNNFIMNALIIDSEDTI
jgi:hypothetical protein